VTREGPSGLLCLTCILLTTAGPWSCLTTRASPASSYVLRKGRRADRSFSSGWWTQQQGGAAIWPEPRVQI
jgi:hypothetical protein